MICYFEKSFHKIFASIWIHWILHNVIYKFTDLMFCISVASLWLYKSQNRHKKSINIDCSPKISGISSNLLTFWHLNANYEPFWDVETREMK